MRFKTISSNLLTYGVAHGVVDAICSGVLFSILKEQDFSLAVTTYMFVIYNLLAFGLQVFVGFFVDYFKVPRLSALLGILLTGISAIVFVSLPLVGVILAGIGNALFHVGGGVISLSLTPRKATSPGIFVAPGALGLMAGTLLGNGGYFTAWPFLLAIAFLSAIFFIIPRPALYQERPVLAENREFKFEYIIYLVLFVVAIRSLVGLAIVFPWKLDISLLVMLTLSIALGKGLGGFLADRFRWTPVAVGSLVISIPLLTLGVGTPVLGMIGMFLFNITMPVTLSIVSNVIPGRPGLAFGLTCLALVLGTLPAFSEFRSLINGPVFIGIAIAVSALALYAALGYYHGGRATAGLKTGVLSRTSLAMKSPRRE